MCTFTCNSHDGSGHKVLGCRAVFKVCCVLILCPFGSFIWTRYVAVVSSNFARGVCSTIFVLAERFPMRFESSLSVMCRKCCSSVDAWIAMLVVEPSSVPKQQKIVRFVRPGGKVHFLFTHHQTIRFRTHTATTVSSPTDVEPSSPFFQWFTFTSSAEGFCVCWLDPHER